MAETSQRITVYGASWCPDARRARRFLDERGVEYLWIDIDEDNAAREFVKQTNGGQVIIPVLVFPDRSTLVEPSNSDLAAKFATLSGEADAAG